MGSNDRWSSGLDLTDVAMNIVGFEAMNKVRIVLTMAVIDRKGEAEIELTATAMVRDFYTPEVQPLASVKSTCSAMNVKSLEAAVIHVLYLLDGRLGRQELRKEVKN